MTRARGVAVRAGGRSRARADASPSRRVVVRRSRVGSGGFARYCDLLEPVQSGMIGNVRLSGGAGHGTTAALGRAMPCTAASAARYGSAWIV